MGISCISLITDQKFFRGNIGHLPVLKHGISLPVFRKDFVIDAIQIRESFHYGADAVLLIARILSREKLKLLFRVIRELGMEALVEIHVPALESSHAFAGAFREAPALTGEDILVINQSGREDKDIFTIAETLGDPSWKQYIQEKAETYRA